MVVTARQFETQKKQEEIKKVSEQKTEKKEQGESCRFFLQHPDGDITCDFFVDILGVLEKVKLDSGRSVIKNRAVAEYLIKEGYIQYRKMEVKK